MKPGLISAEGSRLLAKLFNRMPVEALKDVPEDIRLEIGGFMFANGYRMVFDRWYLQADPLSSSDSANTKDGEEHRD